MATFTDKAIVTTSAIIYRSNSDAANRRNKRHLIHDYQGYKFTASKQYISSNGKVYKFYYKSTLIGFLNADDVKAITKPAAAAQTVTTAKFAEKDVVTLSSTIYRSSSDAANRINKRTLISHYQGFKVTVVKTNILSSGKVYLFVDGSSVVGFLNIADVKSIVKYVPPTPSPTSAAFTDKASVVLSTVIYRSSSDAANRINKQPLISYYHAYKITIDKKYILNSGKVYRFIDGASVIGFLSASDVKSITKASDAAPVPPTAVVKSGNLTTHFNREEFTCGCKRKYCDGYGGISDATLKQVAEVLELVRLEANRKYPNNGSNRQVIIRSGVRCVKYNRTLGSGDTSQHVKGKAADISITGLSQTRIKDIGFTVLRSIKYGGIGYGGNHYTHIDIRNKASKPMSVVSWTY
jgi:hypothetical protein